MMIEKQLFFYRKIQYGVALTSAGLLLMLSCGVTVTHDSQPVAPHDLWQAWNWSPGLLFSLILIEWAYGRGIRRLWSRVGVGRCIERWRVMSFLGGLLTLLIALISPLDPLGEALFSAHMVQHLLLVLIAPPLLVLGMPVVPLLWALPKAGRHVIGRMWRQAGFVRVAWQVLTQPVVVWLLYAVTLWGWHLPRFYQLALETPFIHELEHLSFLGTSLLFWWILLRPHGHRPVGHGGAIVQLFTTALHSGALGALLTFSQVPLYPFYANRVTAWNLTLLQDQQLAGLIMWIPAGIIYLLTIIGLLLSWLQTTEARMQRREAKLWTPP
jgi:cytochrome c oxidase assembly factor CtaG